MKRIFVLLFVTTAFAQNGNIYVASASESARAKAAYAKVIEADKAMTAARNDWDTFQSTVKKARHIDFTHRIEFNRDFTTFSESIYDQKGFGSTIVYPSTNSSDFICVCK